MHVLGATNFDSVSGMSRLPENWRLRLDTTDVLELKDEPLLHRLLMTRHHIRDAMTAFEEAKWFELYVHILDTLQPDLVWFYGGRPLDFLIADEAKQRNIPVAAYLVNGNYTRARWCRDVDLIITDTRATAAHYYRRLGLQLVPVGKFIDPSVVVSSERQREYVLFVNPMLEKGGGLIVQIAMHLEKRRPDIRFEVVESRGNWDSLVQFVAGKLGALRPGLNNVLVTPITSDMSPVYARARILLAPALWWESGSRVVAEAMVNGIPAIVTDNGGNKEMSGDGGILIQLPERYYSKPYDELLDPELLERFAALIVRFHDDQQFYNEFVDKALYAGRHLHDMGRNTAKLDAAFSALISGKRVVPPMAGQV